jgi:electron transfer flavoprotein alpha subunit
VAGVMVFAERQGDSLAEVTYELLAAGRQLSEALGCELSALLVGPGAGGLASGLGSADVVVCAEDPQLAHFTPDGTLQVLEAAVQERSPRLVLLPSTSQGLDLAAPLAARTGLPLVAYCRELWAEDGVVVAHSQVYGGKLMVEVALPERGIACLLPGSVSAEAGRAPGTPRVEFLSVPAVSARARFRQRFEPEAGDVDITREDILVAVGRGIGDRENLSLVEELAEVLGGAVCASRPLVDSGWLPKNRQVGKSGLVVKPKLYLAVGISGAPEHLEGMKDSELIVAVNTDARAPIFDVAHYGVVADLFDFLPALTEAVRQRKG